MPYEDDDDDDGGGLMSSLGLLDGGGLKVGASTPVKGRAEKGGAGN